MVAAGELTDRVGGRTPLLLGVGAFLAGLLTAGLAADMAVFLLGRALQGVGVGLLIVVTYVVVGDQYPERLRTTVFGAISAAWVIPSLVGPVVAGTLHSIELRTLALEARGFGRPIRRELLWAPADSRRQRAIRWIVAVVVVLVLAAGAVGALPRLP